MIRHGPFSTAMLITRLYIPKPVVSFGTNIASYWFHFFGLPFLTCVSSLLSICINCFTLCSQFSWFLIPFFLVIQSMFTRDNNKLKKFFTVEWMFLDLFGKDMYQFIRWTISLTISRTDWYNLKITKIYYINLPPHVLFFIMYYHLVI